MDIEKNIRRIRDYRHHKGWSVSKLASEAGLGESTIRKIDDDDWNPTAETIAALESAIPSGWRRRNLEEKHER